MTIVKESALMGQFRVLHLRFVARSREAIQLGVQPGSNLRGALYAELCNLFSPNAPIPGLPLDPVRHLLEAEDENNPRGRNLPRAFAVEPPTRSDIQTGEQFEFGVSLFGTGIALMPYILQAGRAIGEIGIGLGRGRFQLMQIDEYNPLSLSRRIVMQANRVMRPILEVTHEQILKAAENRQQGSSTLTLCFLTPMRLIEAGILVQQPALGALLRRLLERAQALVEYYSELDATLPVRDAWHTEWEHMGRLGDCAEIEYSRTRWVDIRSFSHHKGRSSPIGGFIGEARWKNVAPALYPWLLWGQSLHVGKNVVKGDGWYVIR